MISRQSLESIADKMIMAIDQELSTNMAGYRKYPTKVENMIKNLRDITEMLKEHRNEY